MSIYIKSQKNNITKSAFLLTIVTVFFKLLAFVKQAVLAYVFGTSTEMDAYFIALGFVVGVAETIVQALNVSVITLYSSILINKGKEKADDLINTILEFLFPFFIGFCCIISATSPFISKILAPSFNISSQKLIATYIISLSPLILFSLIELIFGAVIDAHKKFLIPRLKSFINSFITIFASVFLSSVMNVNSLILGEFLTGVVFIIILFFSVKKDCKLKFIKIKITPEIKTCLKTALPLFIGNGALQINSIVDRTLATNVGMGGVSALTYSQTVTQLVTQIIIINTASILFAHFADYAANNDISMIKRILTKANNIFIFILSFISIISIIFSQDIVKIIFYRGAFNLENVNTTAFAFVGYAISFVFFGIRDLFVKTHYALSDTLTPMITSVISIILNIIISIYLSSKIGIVGITLGTSISILLETIINSITVSMKIKDYPFRNNFFTIVKLIPCSIITTIISLLVKSIDIFNSWEKLIVSTILGFIIFILVAYLTNIIEIKEIISSFICRVFRKRKA